MKYKFIVIILFIGLGFHSCSEVEESNNELTVNLNCDNLYEQQDYTTLTGTLVINSKGEFVFKSISDNSLGIAAPTYLVPCSASLNEYIAGQYIGFASTRRLNDQFWITVTGKYLNLQDYKNQSSDFEQLEFLYDEVALVEKPLENQAFIFLDSINSIDQNELIKINTRGCVNNCLPKASFYKVTNFRQELNKIGYDVVWQMDFLNYKLVQFVR